MVREDRELALKLRLKGYSYNEINRKLGIPKSTLSGWFRSLSLSKSAQQRIKARMTKGTEVLIKRNKMQTPKAWKRAHHHQASARKDILKISKRELFLIGVALYWAEGYKRLVEKDSVVRTHHIIGLTNSDPDMVALFVRFLTQTMNIPKSKIRVSMRLFKHGKSREEALRHWYRVTGIPKRNFEKPSYIVSRSSQGKRPYNRLPYGTVQIRVGDTNNFHRLIGWIEGMKKSAKI